MCTPVMSSQVKQTHRSPNALSGSMLYPLQALCKVAQFPPALLDLLLQPKRYTGQMSPGLGRAGLPASFSAFQRQHNPSQQAAIAAALDTRQSLVSLIQVQLHPSMFPKNNSDCFPIPVCQPKY